jgi:hypothetical protein
MTGALFGTLCQTFVAGMNAGFISSLYRRPRIEVRKAYNLLFDNYLGPNNADNMASDSDTKLASTSYNGEKKMFTWETYVRIHMEQHAVFNGLKEYGYSRIDDCSKVRHLMKGIKTTELDVCKDKIVASPNLRDNFAGAVELYSTFIKQMKAENLQMNFSEVNCSKNGQGDGKSYSGKRGSSGISNSTNAAIDDHFYEKHEYLALSSDQNNILCLKRVKHGHVPNQEGGG